jgi:nucleoside-diphosphate-sugar epimerase
MEFCHVNLFVFGLGYTARHFIDSYGERFTRICGTSRSPQNSQRSERPGVIAYRLEDAGFDLRILDELASADALLVSIPPSLGSDLVLDHFADAIRANRRLRWIGYLSSADVYGDVRGQWVDEDTAPDPDTPRSRHRIEAEQRWLRLGQQAQFSVQIFRLAGVYGPRRNPLQQIADGGAKRSIKPCQVFNRVHVTDVVQVLIASMEHPSRGAIYNVADDEPAPHRDVITFAAGLLGREPPPEAQFAGAHMSRFTHALHEDYTRVRNTRIKTDLGLKLIYPTYRDGLEALFGDPSLFGRMYREPSTLG